MTQSRRGSLIEATTNILVGYSVSVLANYLILPVFGYRVSMGDSAAIGALFTIISLVRSYVLRRVFIAWFRG